MSEKKIILFGGGGHCRSCIDVIETNKEFKIAGIIERPGNNKTASIFGYPIIGYDNDLEKLREKYDYALITVGQIGVSKIRKDIFNRLKKAGFVLPAIISPFAYVSKYAVLNEGAIVMHRVIVNAGAKIGKNCILNTSSLIEHDAKIGDHTHISTAAVINGAVVIGSQSFIGSNATVVQCVKLPDGCFVKAGSLIAGEKDGKAIR